jgi:MoxR-like ATPase
MLDRETLERIRRIRIRTRTILNTGIVGSYSAVFKGRGYVIPEDVKEVAPDVLRHRVLLSYEAEAENVSSDQVVSRILERIEVP